MDNLVHIFAVSMFVLAIPYFAKELFLTLKSIYKDYKNNLTNKN